MARYPTARGRRAAQRQIGVDRRTGPARRRLGQPHGRQLRPTVLTRSAPASEIARRNSGVLAPGGVSPTARGGLRGAAWSVPVPPAGLAARFDAAPGWPKGKAPDDTRPRVAGPPNRSRASWTRSPRGPPPTAACDEHGRQVRLTIPILVKAMAVGINRPCEIETQANMRPPLLHEHVLRERLRSKEYLPSEVRRPRIAPIFDTYRVASCWDSSQFVGLRWCRCRSL
jgi:hypothetical protein